MTGEGFSHPHDGGVARRVWVFGDDVDTDAIVPGRYLRGEIDDIVPHVMEGIRPAFVHEVRRGDVVVGGRNFGTGSSRELAVVALQRSGIEAVIAVSFARIFFRNCINSGLLAVECRDATRIRERDRVAISVESGTIRIEGAGEELAFLPIPAEIKRIVDCGGLEQYVASVGRD